MFKNKKFEVKMVKDSETPAEPSKPDAPFRDPWFEFRMLVEESTPKIIGALIAYKLCTTAIRAAEHVVVTKVK